MLRDDVADTEDTEVVEVEVILEEGASVDDGAEVEDVEEESAEVETVVTLDLDIEEIIEAGLEEGATVADVDSLSQIDFSQLSSSQVLFGKRNGQPTILLVQRPKQFLGRAIINTAQIPEGTKRHVVEAGSLLVKVEVAQLNSELGSSTNLMEKCNNNQMGNFQGFCSSYKHNTAYAPNFSSNCIRPPTKPARPYHSHRSNSYMGTHFHQQSKGIFSNNPEFHLPTMFDLPFH